MKKIRFLTGCLMLLGLVFLSGCYKMQKDYEYVKTEIDPHYDITAKQYLLSRGINGVRSDTIFKWMQMGIEYAGIDIAEYEKPDRTFIFLHNNAIKVWDTAKKVVTAGLFFDYPMIVKDASGNPIKSKLDNTLDSTRPALTWSDYSKEFVKNYLLYLIIQSQYGFDNVDIPNQSVQTLLPPGTKVSTKDSRLSWVVTKTTPNPDPTLATSITLNPSGGSGFDPEGKMNLRIANNDASPIVVNDRTNDRTAGFYFTNGRVHVYDKTIHPFRYSWQ